MMPTEINAAKMGAAFAGASPTSQVKGEPLARETATKTDENNSLSWPHERFFSSSLVFDIVTTALYQLGEGTCCLAPA
jgi:hypothetical protein